MYAGEVKILNKLIANKINPNLVTRIELFLL